MADLPDAGPDAQPDTNPNTVIAKAKIEILRTGCAIIGVTFDDQLTSPYGMKPESGMNCIPALRHLPGALARGRCWLLGCAVAVFAACGVEPSESADRPMARDYRLHFDVHPDPQSGDVAVTMTLEQRRDIVREVTFPSVPGSIRDFAGDGDLRRDGPLVRWLPPQGESSLRWIAHVEYERDPQGFDAWLGPEWGLFRAEDIIPRARTRALKGAVSTTTLRFHLPAGWSVITEYPAIRDTIPVNRPERRFDLPAGWMVMGDLGVRRERIAGVRVAVAAPNGQRVRRMDMLALLNWTLPELVALLPDPPTRLTVVSAGDPMWRGGLSAPASLFIHAERPLISENATSALLHEVMHATLSLRAGPGMDWIIEGFAEYYGLELLRRGGAITPRRHATAIADQADWARQAERLCDDSSTGPTTAKAVTVLNALDEEISDATAGEASLDDVLRALLSDESTVDLAALSEKAALIIGAPSDVLHIDNLPGCHNRTSDNMSP